MMMERERLKMNWICVHNRITSPLYQCYTKTCQLVVWDPAIYSQFPWLRNWQHGKLKLLCRSKQPWLAFSAAAKGLFWPSVKWDVTNLEEGHWSKCSIARILFWECPPKWTSNAKDSTTWLFDLVYLLASNISKPTSMVWCTDWILNPSLAPFWIWERPWPWSIVQLRFHGCLYILEPIDQCNISIYHSNFFLWINFRVFKHPTYPGSTTLIEWSISRSHSRRAARVEAVEKYYILRAA